MQTDLTALCAAWQRWATSADRSENGWESDFPGWSDLIRRACSIMQDADAQLQYLAEIDLCWQWSEETEDMIACTKHRPDACWPVLIRLAGSDSPKVRWQVYAALPSAGPRCESYLRVGLNDPDAYCRRRALLALIGLDPDDLLELKRRFSADSDPTLRQIAARLPLTRSERTPPTPTRRRQP